MLKALQSAQPERAIKDCRNCKFGNYNDHWNTNFCYCSGDCNNWDKWEPSAQPDVTDINVGDTISRQQAIDGMRKLQRWNVVRGYNKNEGFLYDDVMYLLEKLPSAQPEIIRCKDCKYAKWDDERGDYICNGRAVWKNHYCGYAKRKGEIE